jgi:hypothetical protein
VQRKTSCEISLFDRATVRWEKQHYKTFYSEKRGLEEIKTDQAAD